MLTTVKLYGVLGKEFGKEHKFALDKPIDAISALIANYPEFEQVLVKLSDGVRIFQDEDNLAEPIDFVHPVGKETISIVPVIAGASKWDVGKIIAGIALVGLAIYLGPAGTGLLAGEAFGTGMSWAAVVGMVGASLAFSGLASLLMNPPESKEDESSYKFSGPQNTVRQGGPVPVGYGKLWVGSIVLSSGLYSVDILTKFQYNKIMIEYNERMNPTPPVVIDEDYSGL